MGGARALATWVLAACGLVACSLTACSTSPELTAPAEPSTDTGNLCASGGKPAGPAAKHSPVSFRAEVLPILEASCAFSSCHGSRSASSNNGVFLGARAGAADATDVRAALLGGAAKEAPSLPLVTPADPTRSYLLHKLDGDFCDIPECANGQCGARMPRGGDPLDAASRTIIEAWILQGAPDS